MKTGKRHKGAPDGLPREYLEIWKALSAANERARSRQDLAKTLGLSTHTIQRILVNGDVPRFPQTRNTRIVRSWVRILTRLAFHAGEEPRRWIEMVGIPWNDEASRASEGALRRAASRRTPSIPETSAGPGAAAASGAPAAAGAARDTKVDWPRDLRVGIVDRAPFSSQLPGFDCSFLDEYARRVISALAPDSRIKSEMVGERELVSSLIGRSPGFDLGIGLVETIDRAFLGLEFAPLPGWSVRLSAVCLRRRDDYTAAPAWHAAVSTTSPHIQAFLVHPGGAAAHFLRSQCGFRADQLVLLESSEPEDAARKLLEETEYCPEHLVMLVADEMASALVADELRRLPSVAGAYAVEFLPAAEGEYPSYRLGLAVGPALGGRSRDLLVRAGMEMFASVPRMTSALYAALMVHSVLARQAVDLLDVAGARGLAGLVPFDEASPAFRRMLVEDLTQDLTRGLEQKLLASKLLPADAGHREIARRLAVRFVQRMVPEGWEAGADIAAAQLSGPASPYCRSCAAPLEEEHNKGASDRYCRYCSDEQGRLKPRQEVEQILARWLKHGQGDLTSEEATRRARLFMEAMPAWCNN